MHFLKTAIGRLRLLGILEGASLLILLFIAMPLKYGFDSPAAVKHVGMAHGVLFIAFVMYALIVATEEGWKFFTVTWKLIVASVLPFGTFYADKKILSKLDKQ